MKETYRFSCDRVGSQLKAFRIEQGVTQEDLAEILGVNVRQIRRYESGKQYPTIPHLAAILYKLQKPLWQFVDMDPETAEKLFGNQENLVSPAVALPVLLQAISDRFAGLQQQIQWLKETKDP